MAVGSGAFLVRNAPLGAVISYRLAKQIKPTAAENTAHHGPLCIEICDAAGTKVATLHAPGKAGINEVAWNLSYDLPARLDPPRGTRIRITWRRRISCVTSRTCTAVSRPFTAWLATSGESDRARRSCR